MLYWKLWVSRFLLIAFSLFIIPKEAYHLLIRHQDTTHQHQHGNIPIVEQQHHHCDLLKAQQDIPLSAFLPEGYAIPEHIVYFHNTKITCYCNPFIVSALSLHTPLRGPPALHA